MKTQKQALQEMQDKGNAGNYMEPSFYRDVMSLISRMKSPTKSQRDTSAYSDLVLRGETEIQVILFSPEP